MAPPPAVEKRIVLMSTINFIDELPDSSDHGARLRPRGLDPSGLSL